MRHTQKSGFTLIELLVVIAIIAILSAILFPVFAKAREKARQTACLSNEKQIGIALMQYTQDFDERFPAWSNCSSVSGGFCTGPQISWWQDVIYPYLKSKKVYECPSDGNSTGATNPYNQLTPMYSISTHYNGSIIDGGCSTYYGNIVGYGVFTEPLGGGLAMNKISAPSNTIAVYEKYSNDLYAPDCGYFYNATPGTVTPAPNRTRLFAGHTGMTNYIFADGHTKALKPSQTIASTDLWDATGGTLQTNVPSAYANMQQALGYAELDYPN